ncbi:MAG: hypothetical protein GC172_01750 [Phycisphaera sp.]|nr:hypothetical protein [Phycisphaera sp.]
MADASDAHRASELIGTVEYRHDDRAASDRDWTVASARVSCALAVRADSSEVALRLVDCRDTSGAAMAPSAASPGHGCSELPCTLIRRSGGQTLLLTDLPSRLGLRGGTYVLRSVASFGALLEAIEGPSH